MKKLVAALCSVFLTFNSFTYTEEKIYTLFDELQEKDIDALFEDLNGSLIIYLQEGTKLSLKMVAKSDFFSIEHLDQGASIVVNKPFYMRVSSQECTIPELEGLPNFEFEFSHDCETWKNYSDFFGGVISLDYNPNEDAKQISVSIDLNLKE